MTDYLDKVKQLADSLAAGSRPVFPDDLVFYTLVVWVLNLNPSTLTSRTTPVTMEELQTVLLTQEHRMSLTTQLTSLSLSDASSTTNIIAKS